MLDLSKFDGGAQEAFAAASMGETILEKGIVMLTAPEKDDEADELLAELKEKMGALQHAHRRAVGQPEQE